MAIIADQLQKLGIELPPPPAAAGAYAPVVVVGELAFVSGQLSTGPGGDLVGTVGKEVSLEEGRAAARACGLNLLSQLRAVLGDLDRIERIVRVCGFIRSEGEPRLPAVLDGCSELLIEVFGDAGRHARSVLGVTDLPRNCTVELEAVVALRSLPAHRDRCPATRAEAHQFARDWLDQLNNGRYDVLARLCRLDLRFPRSGLERGVGQGASPQNLLEQWRGREGGGPRALKEVVFDPVWRSLVLFLETAAAKRQECAVLRFDHTGLVQEIELFTGS